MVRKCENEEKNNPYYIGNIFFKSFKFIEKFQKVSKRQFKYNLYIFMYMSKYFCVCCDYDAKVKSSFDKHLKTKKHQNALNSQPKVSPKLAKVSPYYEHCAYSEQIKSCDAFQCKYCDRLFKHRSSLSKHIKYTCKKNKDEDLKELARLLNETIKDKDTQLNKMQKQINKLTNKLQLQTFNKNNNITTHYNLTNVNNAVNNIYLLDYSQTDYSHLTERDYITCIKDCNHCVKTLIESTFQ